MSITHHGRMPSLRALKAFEAAARLGNLTRAAEELAVTQGAVSRQVQELERDLGIPLFERHGPRLKLTRDGRQLAEVAASAFGRLASHVADLRMRQERAPPLTLSMLPSLAAKWMAPRLLDFAHACPEIDLRLTASRHLVNFEQENVDVAVRYGAGNWTGTRCELLHKERLLPVCAPEYATRLGLRSATDLSRATLLTGDLRESWTDWFDAAGEPPPRDSRGPTFADDTSMLEAAAQGLGVALGRTTLVDQDIKVGRLVAPIRVGIAASFNYWLVLPSSRPAHPYAAELRAWLIDQFRATEDFCGADEQG